jgi:hypothetical protein
MATSRTYRGGRRLDAGFHIGASDAEKLTLFQDWSTRIFTLWERMSYHRLRLDVGTPAAARNVALRLQMLAKALGLLNQTGLPLCQVD